MSTDPHSVHQISGAALTLLLTTMEGAKNGLQRYRDNHPQADSQADDEMHAQLDGCIRMLTHSVPGKAYNLAPLVLTGYQLQEALGFLAPDSTDEQLQQQVCLAERNGVQDEDGGEPLPAGMFVWLEEYPDEGCMPLDGWPSIGTAALLSATTTPADIAAEGLTTCNCRWRGEDQVQQCSLHHSHVDAIHEWAERAKSSEARLAAATIGRDKVFEAVRQSVVKLPRFSFLLLNGGVSRVADPSGRWIELDDAAAALEPERVDLLTTDLVPQYRKHFGTAAAVDVLNERIRQIESEGWTPAHDDGEHDPGELAAAASAYAYAAKQVQESESLGDAVVQTVVMPPAWPWHHSWWKPANARRNLVKAGALVQAAIEQIDRSKGRA